MTTPALIDLMKTVDTPTICNAIEVAQGRRGFDAFTRGTMVASRPEAPPIVGHARTATLAAQAPPDAPPEAVRATRMAYYRYMAEAPAPAVAVVQDLDWPDCVGAYWGEINTTVHKGFGLSGALTDGVVRDLGDLPEDFPVIAGSIGPSHAFVHVREIDVPVEVMGLRVAPDDLVHADRHGAVVVPPAVIPDLAAAIGKLLKTERIVLEAARAPDFDFERFETAWTAFERART